MKVGVVGLGSIGLRHAQTLRDLGHEVIGYDPVAEKMWAFQKSYPKRLQCFSDTRAVIIASPSNEHIHDLRTAVTYGVPPLIEKPLAMTVSGELLALVAEMKNDDLPAMVGYNLRFHSCVIQAKTWMDQTLVGNPLWAHFCCAQFNDKPAYQRDGVIRNWSHEIDLALYLLGPATVVGVSATEREDVADILLLHDNGCRSVIHLDYVSQPETRSFHLVGTKGAISADLKARRAACSIGPKSQPYHVSQGDDSFDENYVDELKAFLRRAERKPAFGASLDDGLAALEICDQARKLAGLK